MRYNDQPISLAKTLIAFAISLAFILPFLFLIGTALRTPADFLANPGGIPCAFTFENLKIAWLIPVFVILARGGLTGNFVTAGILNGVASIPFAIYFFHTYFLQVLTKDILDAAALDGAGVLTRFRRIAVPLAMPAIASVVALVFVWTFGDLLVAATILQSNPDSYTLPLAATTLSTKESVNLQGQAAAAFVSLIPMLFVFALAQKSLAAGFGASNEK